jgi:hypothetical protein
MYDFYVKCTFSIASIHYFFDVALDLALTSAKTLAACAINALSSASPHPRLDHDSSYVSIHLGACS